MNCILHFERGHRLSWNRDFLHLDDKTGRVSSVRLNFFDRILRITLGNIASVFGVTAFYSSTIITQKRITAFEQIKDIDVADDIQTLVTVVTGYGKEILYQHPKIEPAARIEPAAHADPLFFSDKAPAIALEVADAILSYLPPKDVANMQLVSKTWNWFIKNNTHTMPRVAVSRYIHTAYKIVLGAPLSSSTKQAAVMRCFKSILNVAVRHDLELTKKIISKAKEIGQRMESLGQSMLLCELLKIEAFYDIPAALVTAEAIDPRDQLLKEEALFHVALYREQNFVKAQAIAQTFRALMQQSKLEELIEEKAKTDIVGAKELLDTIIDPQNRLRAQLLILRAELAEKNPDAYAQIEQIENPLLRYQVELFVAIQDMPHDFSKSIEVAKTIDDLVARDEALTTIVEEQSAFDIEGAKKTAALISEGSFQRRCAEDKIYRVKAASDKTLAIQWVTGSADFLSKLNLFRFLAKQNSIKAQDAALSFRDPEEQIIALTVLANLVN
ncbi:MAG: F-box protein [Verrucomicrobia bacterium]|nr:F-box protein [Verrucomicrobiota bacterium]MBS0638129.1 F-box protein [Verrucomicrobiota bacterium]